MGTSGRSGGQRPPRPRQPVRFPAGGPAAAPQARAAAQTGRAHLPPGPEPQRPRSGRAQPPSRPGGGSSARRRSPHVPSFSNRKCRRPAGRQGPPALGPRPPRPARVSSEGQRRTARPLPGTTRQPRRPAARSPPRTRTRSRTDSRPRTRAQLRPPPRLYARALARIGDPGSGACGRASSGWEAGGGRGSRDRQPAPAPWGRVRSAGRAPPAGAAGGGARSVLVGRGPRSAHLSWDGRSGERRSQAAALPFGVREGRHPPVSRPRGCRAPWELARPPQGHPRPPPI